MSTEWNGTTDIYNIVDSLNAVKKRYIPDEDETTLALGIYGYITDTEAKKIQTSAVMTGQLGNEMFPTRAKLTKNVLTHAVYNGIIDINAVPAHMTINMGIRVDDLDRYMINNRFVIDCKSPIFIGDYEFHFDYDIIIMRSSVGVDSYVYSAHYDMTENNRISTVSDAYLNQPFIIQISGYKYVIFQATVRQVTIEETSDKIVTNSIVENKTYTFEFENKLADFDVYVTDNGKTTRLTPVLYGSTTEGIENYCWYLFTSDNTIRISFDSKSYIPGLNSDILIRAYTTLGADGNFSYKKIDDTSTGFYTELDSETQGYNKITCFTVAVTDSLDGSDKKTKEELQKLIPKAALSRGSITTETDISNYFNLLDSENNRLDMRRKVDNNISRVWYGYFLLKDDLENIIPTNTITMKLDINDGSMYLAEDGRYILPAGSVVKYDPLTKIGTVVDEIIVPELFSEEYFSDDFYYYMTVYNIILNPNPLYAAFYLTISDKDSFFIFNWVNENSILQFVTNSCNFQRNLLTDQSQYKFTFNMAQSISDDYGLYYEEQVEVIDENGEIVFDTVVTNNMKAIIVLYKEDGPYRWLEANMKSFDPNTYISSWEALLQTDNGLDNTNNIKIDNLHVVGSDKDINYGYFSPNTKAVLYTLAKFDDGEYGRYNLDSIAPGFEGYTVTNVYEISDGLKFYENFSNVLDTRVKVLNDSGTYSVTGVPVVGMHYMTDEMQATYLIDAIYERKAYIEYCLNLLENSMNVDFKFFNTYGPSLTYTIGDKEKTSIGHVDLYMKLRLSLKNVSDLYIKNDIIKAIKEYIENLYETGDWHAPNMISEISNKYSSQINYLEFMNYNEMRLGIQHITIVEPDDPHIVPEFINIRNRYNFEGLLEPCIDIEIVTD